MASWRGYAGLFFIVLGFVLTIISLSTLAWVVSDAGATERWCGLLKCQVCIDDSCSGYSFDDVSKGGAEGKQLASALRDGGRIVLGIGIASLVVAVAGVVLGYVANKQGHSGYRLLSLFLFFAAGSMTILCVFLYSNKTVLLDYAFILYLFASFTSLIGVTTVLSGPGVTAAK